MSVSTGNLGLNTLYGVPTVTLAIVCATLAWPITAAHAQPEREPLVTQGFEETAAGEIPAEWSVDYGQPESFHVTADEAHEGAQSLWLSDQDYTKGVGLRSPKMPAEPDELYFVEGWWLGEQGNSASLYLEFWNDESRIDGGVHSFGCAGTGKWTQGQGMARAPEGTVAVTVLMYSWSGAVTEGYFDDVVLGRGVPKVYDRTPQPPANVDHPVGLYREEDLERARRNIERHEWAAARRDSIIRSADWWMDLPADEIAEWIPDGTPFRVCDCPNCGAHWGVGPWSFTGDDRVKCKRCGTVFPNEEFAPNGVEKHLNPLGEWEEIRYYEDEEGRHYRLPGLLRYGRIRNLSRLGSLGRAYALTGDVAYAERVRDVLLRVAEVYPAYIAHDWYRIYTDYNNLQSGKLSGWKLHDASTFIELCIAYDLTVESGVYSDEDRSLIEEGAFREAGRLLTATSPRGCCVNDGPFLMAAGGYIGKLLRNHDYVAWALEPPNGFFGFIEENFWRDGHWEDGSPSYEGMALSKFYVLPEIMHGYSDPADYTGEDRYDGVDMFSHPLMSRVLIAGLHVTAPDGCQPPINDSTWGKHYGARHTEENYFWFPTRRNLRLMKFAYGDNAGKTGGEYALFRRDPEIDFDSVEPLDLAADSLVRPGLGWAILRAGEGPDESMVVLDYGPVRGHAHPDKLNYLFYAHERELVTDLGYLSARHHWTPWLKSSAAHNQVLVDGDAQHKASGELLSFAPGQVAGSIRAEAPDVYEQADRYERTLVLISPPGGPPYVVDCFRVQGGEKSVMSFHADGETFDCPLHFEPMEDQPITKEATNGDWVRSSARAETDGAFIANWRIEPDDEYGVRLSVLDDETTAAYHLTAPGLRERSTPWADRTLHLLMWEQAGPDGTFVSVAEAVEGTPRLASIGAVECSAEGARGVRVERDGHTDYVFFGDSPDAEVTAAEPNDLTFTGREAVLSVGEDGPWFARLVDGTRLRFGEISLQSSGPISGTITAFDDEADTITTDAALPDGDTLRGQQLLVAGRVDGAYEIASVEAGDGDSVVHLAREPIMRVEEGDSFTIPSVVEARRLDDGTWAVTADTEIDATLPAPEGFNSRVMLRTEAGWREVPYTKTDGSVAFSLKPDQLQGGSALLLFTDGDVDLNDLQPPEVSSVRVDGEPVASGSEVDLGYIADPRVIAIELTDNANGISASSLEVSLKAGGEALDASLVPGENPREAQILIRLRDLPRDEHVVRASVYDRAANRREVTVRLNTRGHVYPATGLAVVGDSGRLSKPLSGLETQFYRGQEVGDWVEYEFEAPRAGRYAMQILATGYSSYGAWQVSVDGEPIGEPVDAYRPNLTPGGVEASLGEIDLDAGTHRLRLEVVGNNEASSGHFIGWHSLVLRPLDTDDGR